MRNHHNRLTPVKLVQVFHDFFFIIGIQRVGGFIEKDKFGVLIHGAGDQDALTLALTDAVSIPILVLYPKGRESINSRMLATVTA